MFTEWKASMAPSMAPSMAYTPSTPCTVGAWTALRLLLFILSVGSAQFIVLWTLLRCASPHPSVQPFEASAKAAADVVEASAKVAADVVEATAKAAADVVEATAKVAADVDSCTVTATPHHVDKIRAKLRAASYTYCSGKQRRSDILRFLDHQDSNHTGTIDYTEFSRMARKRVPISQGEVQCLCKFLDANGNGCIELDEFVKFLTSPYEGYHKRTPTAQHVEIEVQQQAVRSYLQE